MKIGLLTVSYSNYGSFFQAAALYKMLEKNGYECEFIDEFIGPQTFGHKLGYAAYRFLPKCIMKKVSVLNPTLYVYNVIESELRKYNISPMFRDFSEIEDRYDVIMIGSDELWSVNSGTVRDIDEYFGIHVRKPILSYATSGASAKNITEAQNKKIGMALSRFSDISVRDRKTYRWVTDTLGLQCHMDIDPTLLNPYFKISNGKNENYIIVYGEHFTPTEKEQICDFAKKNRAQLVSFAWRHAWCDKEARIDNVEEIHTYFANAMYIMTATFHGTVFSVIHNKPFTAFVSDFRKEKIEDVLETLCLRERVFTDHIVEEKIDYETICKRIDALREESEKNLFNALEGIKNAV